jgi:ABC-type nitrate/sulfonate/bicarbonate transport system substrate-binding protein
MTSSTRVSDEGVQVWYTYCHVICAGTVDDHLGWTEDELRRHGARLDYFRSAPENDFYPHYTHNLDGLFRYGGCIPSIHARADVRETLLLGLQWFWEGGGMLVRSGDDIHRMADLRGRKIGISRSLNPIKSDYRRITEERGIESMLLLNGMSRDDVEIVDCPFADDWYDEPEMKVPLERLSQLWRLRDVQKDLKHRPLEAELQAGVIDACFVTDPFDTKYMESGTSKLIESLNRYPDWTHHVTNTPWALTCTRTFADHHPELVTAYLKGMVRVGRWCNADRWAAAELLEKTDFYPPREVTYESIKRVDFVPNLSPMNLRAVAIEKDFMLSHGYIENDFDVREWAAPEFLEAAGRELAEEAPGESPVA